MARQWLGLLFFGLVGCAGQPEGGGVRPGSEQLQGRLDAALAMTNLNRRDEALRAIAEDATAAGDVALTKRVLEHFTSLNLKDQTAAACALKLSEAGQPQAAVEVAQRMHNLNQRDEVLERIAKAKK
jgi:hypothetical protein